MCKSVFPNNAHLNQYFLLSKDKRLITSYLQQQWEREPPTVHRAARSGSQPDLCISQSNGKSQNHTSPGPGGKRRCAFPFGVILGLSEGSVILLVQEELQGLLPAIAREATGQVRGLQGPRVFLEGKTEGKKNHTTEEYMVKTARIRAGLMRQNRSTRSEPFI